MKSKGKKIELLVRRTIESHGLLAGKLHVVVGFSGGPDSTGLLAILSEFASDYGITPLAVYIDHGLRPSETLEEIGFVQQTAQTLGVRWETRAVGVREYAREKKLSLEHAARDLRYEALRAVAAKYPRSVLAVAHNADDQAEEILLRLLRGSGRQGLSGMRHKNGDVIRPLLDLRKEEILSYLTERGLSHCVDSSNVDDRFVRNRIRLELLPYLERRFDKGVRRALIKTASILAEDEELLEQLASDAYQRTVRLEKGEGWPTAVLKREEFGKLPGALRRRVVEKLLWHLGSRAHYEHIMKTIQAAERGTSGTELHLKQGLRVGVERDFLRFSYPEGRRAWRGRLHEK